VRTTAYTHTEADHLAYGNHNALGGRLHAATGAIRRAEYTPRAIPVNGDDVADYRRVSYSGPALEKFSLRETKTTKLVKTKHGTKKVVVTHKPQIGSAAADWSRWPAGTVFRLISTGQVYRVDDYGWALAIQRIDAGERLVQAGSSYVGSHYEVSAARMELGGIEQVKEERNIDIPIMVSGTITDASGRTLSGQTVEAFLISVSHIPLLSVGFNCALGADLLKPYLQTLSHNTSFNISAHPNAGLPNAFGEYDETPEEMQAQIRSYLDDNLINIIGGCCGTTPNHIKLIADIAKDYKPRVSTAVM